MSLKAFHIVFITIAILFLLGFALWFFLAQPSAVQSLNVFGGLLSMSLAGGLILYEIRFLRKFKHIPTL